MSPRKIKTSRTVEEIEAPAIAINMDEVEAKIRENAEALKRTEEVEVKEPREPISPSAERIKHDIDKVMAKDGVAGCIIRNATSASISLRNPTRLTDHAVLSSSAAEAGEQLSDLFKLGDVRQLVVEGSTSKLFSFTAGDHKVSVFMEKTVDHRHLRKDLHG